jgi:anti-sigma factor RsiW
MSCQELRGLLDAHIDSELDLVTTLQFDRHLTECASCRASREQHEQFNRAVRAQMPRFDAPPGLEHKIRVQLRSADRTRPALVPSSLSGWRPCAIAASLIGLLAFGAISFTLLRPRAEAEVLAQQVVSSHIRSLMADHLSDVASTDQHTVKPWFTGKLDFAPVVQDLARQGFPLIGGRLDYLDDHPVAALVYKHRKHTINLFLWPSGNADLTPRTLSIRGFNIVHWTQARMSYWAVSDLNAIELSEFARDLKARPL